TPEWRLVMAMRRLAVRGAALVPSNLAEGLRNDPDERRLRRRSDRARGLRERGRGEPRGDAATLAQAHARVVGACQLLAAGAIHDPTAFEAGLELEPVNFRGAVRAASTALEREQARGSLRRARHERRVAAAVRAGELGV